MHCAQNAGKIVAMDVGLAVWCTFAAVLCAGALSFQEKSRLTPDGAYYLKDPGVRPYVMRSLLPALLRLVGIDGSKEEGFASWRRFSLFCVTVSGVFCGLWAGSPWATVALMGLPLVRVCVRAPVLTDHYALLLFCLGLYTKDPLLMVLGGLFNEKVPLFGALALWSPVALVGLVFPVLFYLHGRKPSEGDPEWLRSPFWSAWEIRGRFLRPEDAVLPWGGALLGLQGWSARDAAYVAVAYAQLLCAQDCARLYCWAFPVFFSHVPPGWGWVCAAGVWCNPFRGAV